MYLLWTCVHAHVYMSLSKAHFLAKCQILRITIWLKEIKCIGTIIKHISDT